MHHPHTAKFRVKSIDFQGKGKGTPLQAWTGSTRLIRLLLSALVRNHDPFEIVGVTTFTSFSLEMAVLHVRCLHFFVLGSIFYVSSST